MAGEDNDKGVETVLQKFDISKLAESCIDPKDSIWMMGAEDLRNEIILRRKSLKGTSTFSQLEERLQTLEEIGSLDELEVNKIRDGIWPKYMGMKSGTPEYCNYQAAVATLNSRLRSIMKEKEKQKQNDLLLPQQNSGELSNDKSGNFAVEENTLKVKVASKNGSTGMPGEVNYSEESKELFKGYEYSVREITGKRENGSEVKLIFKNKLTYSNPMVVGGRAVEYSGKEVEERAIEIKNEYQNAVLCFGSEHVAVTDVVVGNSDDLNRPEVHVYQEKVDEVAESAMGLDEDTLLSVFSGISPEKMIEHRESVKRKSYDQLDTADPYEKTLKEGIRKHQVALKQFYPALVESVLLGYVPDLQHYGGSNAYVGLLETINCGFIKDSDSKERYVIFDFGEPVMDLMSIDARRKLRELINDRKKQGESAIHTLKVVRGNGQIETDSYIAPWYKEALEQAVLEDGLKSGLIEKQTRDNADAVYRSIKLAFSPYFRKLDTDDIGRNIVSFGKLCGAPSCGKREEIRYFSDEESQAEYIAGDEKRNLSRNEAVDIWSTARENRIY